MLHVAVVAHQTIVSNVCPDKLSRFIFTGRHRLLSKTYCCLNENKLDLGKYWISGFLVELPMIGKKPMFWVHLRCIPFDNRILSNQNVLPASDARSATIETIDGFPVEQARPIEPRIVPRSTFSKAWAEDIPVPFPHPTLRWFRPLWNPFALGWSVVEVFVSVKRRSNFAPRNILSHHKT